MARRYNILVGVDFSECAVRAAQLAAQLAAPLEASIDLVHVFPYGAGTTLSELVMVDDKLGHFTEAKQQLLALRDLKVPAAVPVRLHLRLGQPVRGLLDAAEQLHADMVVIGSHGQRGAVSRALLGSVAERLVRKCRVPVLVVPAEGRLEAALAEEAPTIGVPLEERAAQATGDAVAAAAAPGAGSEDSDATR